MTELTSALPWYAERPGLERLDHRGVDAERQLAEALDERNRLAHQVDLVGERVADVDVEQVRAARDLLRDVRPRAARGRPACSCAWNAFRPVGLIRSPITQNGCSGPMTTVLDGDWTTVSTRLPFRSWWDAEPLAEPGDAGLAAETDQVEAGDARQRARVLGELDRDLEALRLRVGRVLAALDQRRRHLDPGHVLVDVAQRRGRAR